MMLSIRTIWLWAGMVCIPMLSFAGWRYGMSASSARVQGMRHDRLVSQAETVTSLGAALPPWALDQPRSLAPEVTATLAAVGLPASAMASLSADGDGSRGASGGGSLSPSNATGTFRPRVRRGTLVLSAITLPQLGSFCAAWRERPHGWVVSGLDVGPELSAPNVKPQAATTGGDMPLRAVLTLESISLEQSGGAR